MSGKRKRSDIVGSKKKQKVEEKALNPFELRVNRKKHDVLCWKSKSEKGLPGVSRSKAIQKRKKTLLEEYKRRNKSNKFVDLRFGEYDETLSAEEKMMRRFMLEKQKKHDRGAAYNLPGDESDQLTHYGQSLGEMESFDDIRITSDEEETEEDIRDTHFGGFLKKKNENVADGNPEERAKTRKEILDEVVAKSKAQKYERQQLKQQTENLLHDIDEQWKAVQALVPKASSDDKPPPPDDYDITMRKMTFEARGRPTDSLKSEVELAAIEKERLEKQEMERVCRMKGLPPSQNHQHTSADHLGERSKKHRVQFMLSYDKDGRAVTLNSSGEDSEGEGGNKTGGERPYSPAKPEEKEDHQSDDESGDQEDSEDIAEQYGSDLESDSDEGLLDSETLIGNPNILSTEMEAGMVQASKELPFVLKVPSSLDEFRMVVHSRSGEELRTAVERIYACNHPSLSPQNKEKLKSFFAILMEYCLELAKVPRMETFSAINGLARSLFKLAHIDSLYSAAVIRRNLDHLRDHTLPHHYPSYATLLIFKIVGTLFPTSDHRHPVTTPTMLIMASLLRKCYVKSMEDVYKGIIIVETMIEYVALSKRFVPEAIVFLTSLLGYLCSGRQGIIYPPFVHKCPLREQLGHAAALCSRQEGISLQSTSLMQLVVEGTLSTSACRNTVALHCTRLVQKLAEIYAGLPTFREIFQATASNLESMLLQENWPPCEKSVFTATLEFITSQSAVTKPALQLLKHKPVSIEFYKPEFDEEFEVRKKAVNRTAGERQRLAHKVKREMKGAVREIRRDNAFLARERLNEQLERDAERERKTHQIMRELEEIQHEAKKELRKK